MLITIRGKKRFNLVVLMLGRVKSFDISNPCLSHHLRPPPSTLPIDISFISGVLSGHPQIRSPAKLGYPTSIAEDPNLGEEQN